ncbi:MAG TPA: polysaccharide deacetylase family protein [Cyclobacteriaceae bacterium]|nr:polysaccharide deacetylase family protein [Cyclobacteriaceae bacterium]
MIRAVSVVFILAISVSAIAQTKPWNGYKSAVVLTYDDALNVHLDNVIPALDSAGFKGTFYLTVSSGAFTQRMPEWKRAADNGHELGNHTMYHPCRGGSDRSWVRPEYDLITYTLKRIDDEVRMTNVVLQSVDGKTERTFAYPCGDMRVGEQSYVETISDDFVAARGVEDKIMQHGKVDPYTTSCFSIAGQTGEHMIDLVKRSMKENGLLVLLFHGVGGEHGLNVELKEHRKLIAFLKENQNDIWIAPFVDVMKYVKTSQAKPK